VERASPSVAYLRFPLTGHFDSSSTTNLPGFRFGLAGCRTAPILHSTTPASVADSSTEIGQNRRHAHASREKPRHQDHNLPENLPEKVNGLPACVKCGAPLMLKPVPGAKNFPLRLECPEHGWQPEELRPIRMRFHKDRPDW